MADLKDKAQFFRFLSVSFIGTLADYLLALFLAGILFFPSIIATTCGFVLGSIVNYCGHAIFSYEHTSRETISVFGYIKYFFAVILSLFVRLLVVVGLGYIPALPFWFVLLCAIGASFVASYLIATLWVFRKSG